MITAAGCGGIPCPDCGCFERSVLETRHRVKTSSVYRRCLCSNCGARYTTQEQLASKQRSSASRTDRLRRAAALDQITRIERSLTTLRQTLPPISA